VNYFSTFTKDNIMDISFSNQLLTDLYEGNKLTDKQFRSNPVLVKQYIKTVNKLKSVKKVEQLFQFAGLNYEKLKGKLKAYSSVRINDQYRLIFEELSSVEAPFQIVLFKLVLS
jgi:proteic killer suppression protein